MVATRSFCNGVLHETGRRIGLEDLTQALARRIQALTADDVPPAAVDWATCAILDTIGVTLGGAGEEAASHVAAVCLDPAGRGSSAVFGTPLRGSALDATMLNALAAHALDYDDVCDVMGGHPSAPLVAPSWRLRRSGPPPAGPLSPLMSQASRPRCGLRGRCIPCTTTKAGILRRHSARSVRPPRHRICCD
jgi:hypothetical protein